MLKRYCQVSVVFAFCAVSAQAIAAPSSQLSDNSDALLAPQTCHLPARINRPLALIARDEATAAALSKGLRTISQYIRRMPMARQLHNMHWRLPMRPLRQLRMELPAKPVCCSSARLPVA